MAFGHLTAITGYDLGFTMTGRFNIFRCLTAILYLNLVSTIISTFLNRSPLPFFHVSVSVSLLFLT